MESDGIEMIILIGGLAYRNYTMNDVDIYIIYNSSFDSKIPCIDKLPYYYKLDIRRGEERQGQRFNEWLIDFWYGRKQDFNFDKPYIILRRKDN